MKKIPFKILAILALFIASAALNAASMTNADVIKMTKAGIDESVIINSVQNAQSGFDTSANGLIGLSQAGVSKPVINAVVLRASGASTPAAPAAGASADAADSTEIIMVDKGASTSMTYVQAEVRAGARAMGWGGVAQYRVLRGATAALRASPAAYFIMAIPTNAAPDSYMTIASFEPRKNGSREVLTGGGSGFTGVVTGIPKGRIVAITFEKLADQSKAPAKHTLYKITPAQPLRPGEFAILVGSRNYDFGVNK
jgi:hypothetical protein